MNKTKYYNNMMKIILYTIFITNRYSTNIKELMNKLYKVESLDIKSKIIVSQLQFD